ncbi:LysR family transcriptional regulator [Enterococcus sp. LJL90]
MELRSYRYFLAIAEQGNISKAAKNLNITQPTLSRQLKELEEELGVELFQREHKQLVLTEAGIFLRERAQEIIQLADKTQQEFLDQRQTLFSGKISIGCVEADNSDTLALMLEEFVEDYPQVSFEIFSSTSEEIIEKLDLGLLDVAILINPIATEKYHSTPLPRKEVWGLLVEGTSFLASKETITPEDLIGVPLLISRRSEVQEMLANWAHTKIDQLNIKGVYNLIFNVIALVENRVASALVIKGATSYHHSNEVKFIPLSPKIETECVFVWRKHKVQAPVVKEFIQRMNYAFKA